VKAVILSAGQGSRLHPLTEDCPKCLLTLGETTMLGHQIQQLAASGVEEIAVVAGFRVAAVEAEISQLQVPGVVVKTVFNPFFHVADNLASCWMARGEMDRDFVIVNGDTIFEQAVYEKLRDNAGGEITMVIDRKKKYDSDDMKVRLSGGKLAAVGKDLPLDEVDGESIGMIMFKGEGPRLFVEVLDQFMRGGSGVSNWYLKAVGVLGEQGHVDTVSIEGLKWGEVDFPEDLAKVRALFG
jgi:choline kinase